MSAMTKSATNMLSLPDDVLLRIMQNLIPPTQAPRSPFHRTTPLSMHFWTQLPPPSFQLAATCTRLLGLFGHTLSTLDVPPREDRVRHQYAKPESGTPLTDEELRMHLTSLVRCAGCHLKVLRIRDKVDHLGTVLDQVCRHCPNLQEIWFTDDGDLDWHSHRVLFASMSLDKIRLTRPTTALISLGEARCMKDLELIGISSETWQALEKILHTAGAQLKRLSLAFEHRPNQRWRDYSSVANYLRTNLHRDLPVLNKLHLKQKGKRREEHLPFFFAHGGVSIDSNLAMTNVQEPVSVMFRQARARNREGECRGIAEMVLDVDLSDARQCAEYFLDFIGEDTIFELVMPRRRFMWR